MIITLYDLTLPDIYLSDLFHISRLYMLISLSQEVLQEIF